MLKFFSIYSRWALILFSLLLVITSCKKEEVPEEFFPTDSHEQYTVALQKLDLSNSALGKDWVKASEKALNEPMRIESPYIENLFFDPQIANSVGYKISLLKGQAVTINIENKSKTNLKTFLDIFRPDATLEGSFKKIASSGDSETSLHIKSNIDTDYIIRFQPELLRGGNFKISIQVSPSLTFPVSGKDNSAIGSLFGVPRDAGRRKHHGIDIFARRHTPIIAPTDGYVRFAGEKGLGGTVVWMRDDHLEQTLYFAHLEDLLVSDGDQITKGDTIGTVGNSGNAKTTSPHLHFGIYQNGPVDPYPFVAFTRTKPKRELADASLINQTIRTKKNAKLKVNDMTRKAQSTSLQKHQILIVNGTSAAYYRVSTPDDKFRGYIDYRDVETISKPIRRFINNEDYTFHIEPKEEAPYLKSPKDIEAINVFGSNENFVLVENGEGMRAWAKSL